LLHEQHRLLKLIMAESQSQIDLFGESHALLALEIQGGSIDWAVWIQTPRSRGRAPSDGAHFHAHCHGSRV
jgi:hypothetical protein